MVVLKGSVLDVENYLVAEQAEVTRQRQLTLRATGVKFGSSDCFDVVVETHHTDL